MARTRRPGRRTPRSPFAVGLFALVVIAILVFLGFTKDIPFTTPYQVKAVFSSSNGLRPSSPVRIAGVEVGKVSGIEAQEGSSNAVVTMSIKESGLPLHADATAKIRPRIFLEGNFFVDLSPGTPGAPELDDGDTIKVTQTSTPVQLDQVLTALQSDTRQDLKDVLEGLGTALSSEPTAADDRDADRSARGETAAESWNDAYDDAGPAARAQSQVNEALLGTEPEQDLGRLVEGAGKTAAGLVRNETQLKDLVRNFNITMAALASEDRNLRTSIRELAPTLENANAALASLNEAFPPTRAFAREILPGVRETPATIDAAFPWLEQAGALMKRARAAGPRARSVAGHARPRAPDRQRDPAAAADRPRLQVRARRAAADGRRRDPRRVRDRPRELQGLLLRHGRPLRRGPELRRQRHVRALPDRRRLAVDLARPRQRGHPAAVRRAADAAARQPAGLPGQGAALRARRALLPPDAARPQRPGRAQDEPARAGRRDDGREGAQAGRARADPREAAAVRHAGGRAVTAIRKHLVDFLAILGLIVVALAVSSVILANQRLALPGWMPVLGQDFTEVDAELSSAQAVTPGQGQTVNVAGVEVGEISRVRLEDGKAIVTLKLEEGSVPVYKDASVLLRPKTGLKDMVAELTPGTKEAGALEPGQRIPIGQTLPDVNLDEILASLDGDTRKYLQLLLADGGQALGGNGRALANTIRRFEPTARDTRKIAEQLATRRQNIKRVIHNFSLVVDELGGKDDQLAEFVENSNAVFATLAGQDANLRVDAAGASVRR